MNENDAWVEKKKQKQNVEDEINLWRHTLKVKNNKKLIESSPMNSIGVFESV